MGVASPLMLCVPMSIYNLSAAPSSALTLPLSLSTPLLPHHQPSRDIYGSLNRWSRILVKRITLERHQLLKTDKFGAREWLGMLPRPETAFPPDSNLN